jgi:predicted  nucleic acid-binding Zn-ribbon protein
MTDDPALLALLDVQAHDTKLDQIRHQLAHLPAQAARDAAAAALTSAEAALTATTAERDELARQQKRVDDEVELLKEKRQGFDTKLYGGTVSNPRELQDLQDEIDSLGRRISHLEDEELEIMEQVEPIEAQLVELTAALAERRAELEAAETALTVAQAELAAALEAEAQVRTEAAVPVPAELLEQYEHLRGGRGGIGVARLVGSQCGGCHLTLSAMEAARMRKLPVGEIGHCEECGRILVP